MKKFWIGFQLCWFWISLGMLPLLVAMLMLTARDFETVAHELNEKKREGYDVTITVPKGYELAPQYAWEVTKRRRWLDPMEMELNKIYRADANDPFRVIVKSEKE